MATQERLDPLATKQDRLDILDALRRLSPEGIAGLAQAAKALIESQEAESHYSTARLRVVADDEFEDGID